MSWNENDIAAENEIAATEMQLGLSGLKDEGLKPGDWLERFR